MSALGHVTSACSACGGCCVARASARLSTPSSPKGQRSSKPPSRREPPSSRFSSRTGGARRPATRRRRGARERDRAPGLRARSGRHGAGGRHCQPATHLRSRGGGRRGPGRAAVGLGAPGRTGRPRARAASTLRDPGNLGAVLRIAGATAVSGVICCAGTVDPYNPKVVRASAGALFRLPLVTGVEPGQVLQTVAAHGYRCWATVPKAGRTMPSPISKVPRPSS